MTRTLLSVMYHYVRDSSKTPFPAINAVPVDDFRRQVKLVKETFATPPLEACVDFLEGRWNPERDLCILTFDDGLREHYEIVADILVTNGVPGAFFLPTAALEDHQVLTVHMNHFLLASLGTPGLRVAVEDAAHDLNIALPEAPALEAVSSTYRWDDPETARFKYLINHQLATGESEALLRHVFQNVLGSVDEFARRLYMSWDEAREMQALGLAVGGHSHTHKVLSRLEAHVQSSDLGHSTELLTARLGEGVRGFAYPYGKPATYNDDIIDRLDQLGYLCAFNTTVGRATAGASRWEIPRIDPKDL